MPPRDEHWVPVSDPGTRPCPPPGARRAREMPRSRARIAVADARRVAGQPSAPHCRPRAGRPPPAPPDRVHADCADARREPADSVRRRSDTASWALEIRRASCRERGEIMVVAVAIKIYTGDEIAT